MFKLIALLLLMGNVAVADTVCKEVCKGVSDEQKACVMKTSCEPKLAKLRRENAKLKKNLKDLEEVARKLNEQLAEASQPVYVKETEYIEQLVYRKNRVDLLAGYGVLGNLKEDKDGTDTIFRTDHGLVLGLQYSRMFNARINWLLQVQTNESVFAGVGTNW